VTHGGKRPGSGAKPKGADGKNLTLRFYGADRERIANWRMWYALPSDAAAVRHMMLVAEAARSRIAGES